MKSENNIICPFCQSQIDNLQNDMVICNKCGSPHHKDCWDTNGQCSTYGCNSQEYHTLFEPIYNSNINAFDGNYNITNNENYRISNENNNLYDIGYSDAKNHKYNKAFSNNNIEYQKGYRDGLESFDRFIRSIVPTIDYKDILLAKNLYYNKLDISQNELIEYINKIKLKRTLKYCLWLHIFSPGICISIFGESAGSIITIFLFIINLIIIHRL